MILIINVCKEKLHYFEFVKPIENILLSEKKDFKTKHYKKLVKNDIEKADKIIICGTSLMDNDFLENVEDFSWIRKFKKPLFGICAGFQIIGIIYGGKIKKKLEIGYFSEKFDKNFFGVEGVVDIYHLHSNYIEFTNDFNIYSCGNISQAVKHKSKEIYGSLFHPEVRHKKIIKEFSNL